MRRLYCHMLWGSLEIEIFPNSYKDRLELEIIIL